MLARENEKEGMAEALTERLAKKDRGLREREGDSFVGYRTDVHAMKRYVCI